jgi:hypothetical protein
VHDIAGREYHCPWRGLDRLIANGKSHLAFLHVENFVFPMVDVRGWNIAFSSNLLLQSELPLCVLTGCEERQQPAAVPERLFEGLPPSTKCKAGFAANQFRDFGCHDDLLSMLGVLAVARRTSPVIELSPHLQTPLVTRKTVASMEVQVLFSRSAISSFAQTDRLFVSRSPEREVPVDGFERLGKPRHGPRDISPMARVLRVNHSPMTTCKLNRYEFDCALHLVWCPASLVPAHSKQPGAKPLAEALNEDQRAGFRMVE